MQTVSRTKRGFINSIFSVVSYLIITVLSLFVQRAFMSKLGYNIIGLNSVFNTIINTLSIVELGIGTAIIFSLYKPIAEKDENKIAAIIGLYRKIYFIVGGIIVVLSLAIIPALRLLTRNEFSLSFLLPAYFIYVINTFFTYIFSYNHTLISADQKEYVRAIVLTATRLVTMALQMASLYIFNNYYVFLAILLVGNTVSNAVFSIFVRKKYAYIKNRKEKLDPETTKQIKTNVVSLLFHRIGNYLVSGTDQLIISGILGVTVAGYYANYGIVSAAVTALIVAAFGSIIAGFGNLIAVSDKEYVRKVFERIRFLRFAVAAVFTAGMYTLIDGFLSLWLNGETVLPRYFLIVFCSNFFLTQYSGTLSDIRSAAGVFRPDRYLHIFIALLNLAVSLALVRFIGITGVILGTLLCLVIKECIVLPLIGAKYVYGGSPRSYYFRLLFDSFIVVCLCVLCGFLGSFIKTGSGVLDFVLGGAMCVFVGAAVIAAVYGRTDDFKYFVGLLKLIAGKIRNKFFAEKHGNKKENNMTVTKTKLDGVYVIEPTVHGDGRGWFMETFRADKLREAGIDTAFVQDNQSMSAQKGTLRGIHFQNFPYAQSKLVRCVRGAVLDVAVDLRSYSPDYKKWVAVELSEQNKKQLFVPRGFGHAFLTLTDDAEVAYKVDEYYNKAADRGINYADGDIGVDWASLAVTPVLSEKDAAAPLLRDSDCNFGARILVTGVNGQLGHDAVKLLKSKGVECRGVDIGDFDLTDSAAVSAYVKNYAPTVIVHCAAYTAVDKAEDDAERCFAVNVTGTQNIAAAAKESGAALMYISTDYVYGGGGKKPFAESDAVSPLSVYGVTKKKGEDAVTETLSEYFILRTSWVFGKNGGNFVKTMLRLAKEKPELNVVTDQIGSPTYTADLSRLIAEMIFTRRYGVYNASNEGYCSWKEFADEIFKLANVRVKVNGVKSGEYAAKARRPLNSRLDKTKLEQNGFARLPDWRDALKRYLKEIE